jgi:hypothetical protein
VSGQPQPRITPAQAATAIADFLVLGLPTVSDDWLAMSAHELTQQYGCAFYNGIHVPLAERLDVLFILANGQFYPLIHYLSLVVWLADYSCARNPHAGRAAQPLPSRLHRQESLRPTTPNSPTAPPIVIWQRLRTCRIRRYLSSAPSAARLPAAHTWGVRSREEDGDAHAPK